MTNPIRTEVHNRDCHRLLDGDKIVGFALRLSNNRWGMANERGVMLTRRSFERPRDVAAAYREVTSCR